MMINVFIFIFGLIWGSFLNVCIYRMPKNESIVHPRSHCVRCDKKIAWYDNIPLLSYIILRARCRYCKEKISFLYFVIELLTGLVFLFFYLYFGFSVEYFVYTALAASLIVVSFIDLKIQEIPDEISLPGMVIGVILCAIFPQLMQQEDRVYGFLHSLLGLFAGGGLIYIMGVIGKAAFKKEAMGGGDVKLMAMLGAFLGWKLITLAFFLAPFFVSFVGIMAKIKNKEEIIPYGPHLSIASIVALLWGDKILNFIFLGGARLP